MQSTSKTINYAEMVTVYPLLSIYITTNEVIKIALVIIIEI